MQYDVGSMSNVITDEIIHHEANLMQIAGRLSGSSANTEMHMALTREIRRMRLERLLNKKTALQASDDAFSASSDKDRRALIDLIESKGFGKQVEATMNATATSVLDYVSNNNSNNSNKSGWKLGNSNSSSSTSRRSPLPQQRQLSSSSIVSTSTAMDNPYHPSVSEEDNTHTKELALSENEGWSWARGLKAWSEEQEREAREKRLQTNHFDRDFHMLNVERLTSSLTPQKQPETATEEKTKSEEDNDEADVTTTAKGSLERVHYPTIWDSQSITKHSLYEQQAQHNDDDNDGSNSARAASLENDLISEAAINFAFRHVRT